MTLLEWNILCIILCLLSTTVLLALRTYVRLAINRQWTLEDFVCYISWAGLIAYCTTTSVAFARYGGVHESNVTLPEAQELSYLFIVTSSEYCIAILFTKLSILLLYRRVFSPHRWSVFDLTIQIFMMILTLFYFITFFVKIWECMPRARIWDKSINGTCVNVSKILIASGSFNTASDTIILLIPVKAVWQLQMKKKKKAGIIAVFTVGLIAPIFSIIGFVVRLRDSANPDNSYYNPTILLWAAAEIASGFCCVCLPTLAPLVHCRRRRQSATLSNGPCTFGLTARKPTTLDHDMFRSRNYKELGDTGNRAVGIDLPSNVVVTNIHGGVESYVNVGNADIETHDHDVPMYVSAGGEDKSIEKARPVGILRTVEIEQSFIQVDLDDLAGKS